MDSKLSIYDILKLSEQTTTCPKFDLDDAKAQFDEDMAAALKDAFKHDRKALICSLGTLLIDAVTVMRYSFQGGILAGAVVAKIITTFADDSPEESAKVMQEVEDYLVDLAKKDEELDGDEEEEPVEESSLVKVIKADSLEDALDQIRKAIEKDIKKEKKKASKKDK